MRFPPSGGLIAYLTEGFGNGRLVGIASWLGYFAAIVIIALTAIVLVFFAVDTVRSAPETFAAIVAIALLSVVLDLLWKPRTVHARR